MLGKLKHLLKHSVIYGISPIATKAIGVILLPLYTSYISLAEFGVLGLIDITIYISIELLNLGLSQALVMLNNSDEYSSQNKSIFFTIFSTSSMICLLFIAIAEFMLPVVSQWFSDPARYHLLLQLSIYVIVLRILNNVLLNKLRADENSITYTALSLSKVVLVLGFAIFFVAFKGMQIEGVLYAYIISEGAVLIVLFPLSIKNMEFHFSKKILGAAAKFGVPLILSAIAMLLLNLSDRYIIGYFLGKESVGLYDLGYRVAGVLNMFVIVPFSMTLMPIAYKMYNTEGDKRYYSKIMTYFAFALVWIGLGLSLFSKEIIKIFALNTSYWPAFQVIPIVTLAYVFYGLRIVSDLGMYLTKNTKPVAIMTVGTAALNIILNIILIPLFGMIIAAYTTLFTFGLLYVISYYFSGRYYPIPYEIRKVLTIVILGALLYSVILLINESAFVIRLLIKGLILIIFPFALYILKFYEPIELSRLKEYFHKWTSPSGLKNIKNDIINFMK
ncbi:MAG: hypothetical protein A2V66_06115 [Ignavibacteria bacterium RBG_13_36_8]|nr:MAG: hypothetical protein A2V66_06115 [Ignavibacteria bacterium RBG_13_36_8]